MKIGRIVKPNAKGQIVIPYAIRKELMIDENTNLNIVVRDKTMYIYSVESVNIPMEKESNFLEVLKKTQGAWGPMTAAEKKAEKLRRKRELQASTRRKMAW